MVSCDARQTAGQRSTSRPPFFVDNYLTDLFEDAEGRLWVGSHRGVFVIKPLPLSDPAAFAGPPRPSRRPGGAPITLPRSLGESFEFTSKDGLDGARVTGILQTADGRVWLTSTKGLNVFDGREFRSFNTAHGLGVRLGTMVEDPDRNLWMGSLNGAVKLVAHGLSTYGKEDGMGDEAVRAIYQTPAGDLYVVAGDWWVSRLVGRRFVSAKPRLGEPGPPLWTSNAAMPDGAGAWWFMSERRLFRFEGVRSLERLDGLRPAAVYQTGPGFHDGAFYRSFEDSRGDVWVGTRSVSPARSGLSRWERATGAFHSYGPAEGFPEGHEPASFCEDRAGALWVGFYHGGLARYAGGRFRLLTPAEGLPEGFVTDLHLDRDGRLWVATNTGGAARVDDPAAECPSFVRYTTADGLSSNNVRAITEDATGRIYLSTVRGLDRLSPDTGRVKHFTTADGLADDFVTAAFRDRDGTLWFGTHRGLSRLAPEPDLPPLLCHPHDRAGLRHPHRARAARARKRRDHTNLHARPELVAAVPPNTQKDDSRLEVAPLERGLVLLQGYDSRRVMA